MEGIVDVQGKYQLLVRTQPIIHVTGPNNGLAIGLFKEDANHTLSLNDSITLSPERYSEKTTYGESSTLFGSTLDYGTYTFFINTTDLTAGYYELRCKRPYYEKMYGAQGFYLVNSSQHSVIEELNAS